MTEQLAASEAEPDECCASSYKAVLGKEGMNMLHGTLQPKTL